MIYTLLVPGWLPTPLNKLLHCHWGKQSRQKKHDADVLGTALLAYGVPPATCKRRVDLLVVLPAGQRKTDVDSLHKSLLDGLVRNGGLVNDSPEWVQIAPVSWARGERLCTVLTLEDLDR